MTLLLFVRRISMDEGASRGGADWGEMGDKDEDDEFIEALSLFAVTRIRLWEPWCIVGGGPYKFLLLPCCRRGGLTWRAPPLFALKKEERDEEDCIDKSPSS